MRDAIVAFAPPMPEPEYVIEKGVPIPETRGGRKMFYPFDKLEKGDSMFIKTETPRLVQNCACSFAKQNGVLFTTRSVEGGVRVWRLA